MRIHYPQLRKMTHSLSFESFQHAFTALAFIFLLTVTAQLVLCRVAAVKSLPVHNPWCRLHVYFTFDPLRSMGIFREFKRNVYALNRNKNSSINY